MSETSRAVSTIQKLNQLGYGGDMAAGALLALIVGLPTYLFSSGTPLQVVGFKIPPSMVWAGLAFIAGLFGSMSLYPFGGGGGS